MRSFYGIALLALPLIGSAVCEEPAVSPTNGLNDHNIYANANEAFQDLLNALPEESLHAALNSLTKFKDGIFESDRHGVEHVHSDNPPLATKLIVAAVQDLKKRQQPAASTNGTTPASSTTPAQTPGQSSSAGPPPSSETPAPSSNPPPASSKAPESVPVVIPVKVTTTDSNGQVTVISTSFLSKATAFIPVDVTHTDSQGLTIVTKETKPAVIFTATDSAGSAFATASAVNFVPTKGQILTETDAAGSTFLTTYTPPPGRVSSIVLVTTMGTDGRPSVITSYTYVDPAEPTATNPPQSTGVRTTPSLQTNAARANMAREIAVLGGMVGGAFVLFV